MSKLTKSPSDLFALWREYEQGLDGGKAAKDYTAVERGTGKEQTYIFAQEGILGFSCQIGGKGIHGRQCYRSNQWSVRKEVVRYAGDQSNEKR